jgi:riboflavin synthase
MFSGIIETIGRVTEIRSAPDNTLIAVATPLAAELSIGESIAVNGVCLTVTGQTPLAFTADVSPTTLRLTTFGRLTPGQSVNLERALRVGDRLSGHIVSGHVDTVGVVGRLVPDGDSTHVTIEYPDSYAPLLVDRGSIAVDGVSLTVVTAAASTFQVTLIPHTQAATILHAWEPGTPVNLEFSLLGKYVRRILAGEARREES